MSTLQEKNFQQQPISQQALQFDPQTLQNEENINYMSESDSISDDEYLEEYNFEKGKKMVNSQSQNQHQGSSKAYHQNQFTKIDQKMCFNKIEACENQELTKQKRKKDKAQRATVEQVLDPRTMLILKKLISNGTLTQINGCLSTGKQANVYYAQSQRQEGKKQYAIKIYKTSILVFKDRDRYVQGQYRFRKGHCSSNPRKMVKMWAEKELRNLRRIQEVIPSPSALIVKSNVLVMDFIGKDGIPAPKLKDADKNTEQFSQIYLEVLMQMRTLYQECKLIHADLSEYNLLYYEDKVYMIDVSQSVEHDHPKALQFLRRDIVNINDFFRKKGVHIFGDKSVFDFIVSLDIGKGRQREKLESMIDDYQGQGPKDQVFNAIQIPRNLSDLSINKLQDQIFYQQKDNDYHHTVTGLKDDKIEEKSNEDSSEQSSSQSEESSQNNNKEEEGEGGEEENKKQGGKQKYEGLNKLERKHKVKEEKREKRKMKMPKKVKQKLTKKK